jgi:signal transduction histidine kinase/DNA-binding NarL/FixJ family response regulator
MRVLIAEDDPSTRHLLRRLVGEWGHTPLTACDGDEAWTLITDVQPPHILIIGAGLPKGGGLGLCRIMRDLPERLRMHVIVSTAIIDSQAMIAAFAAGADDLVEKPFDMGELRLRITAAAAEVRVRLVDAGVAIPPSAPAAPARLRDDIAKPAAFAATATGDRALGEPGERQSAALAQLARHALSGPGLQDFSALAVHMLAEILGARQVQIFERGADGVTLLVRANVVVAQPGSQASTQLKSPAARGSLRADRGGNAVNQISVEIGPTSRPYGALTVEVAPARQLLPGEIGFVTTVAHLVGSVADRERLELQVQQAQKMELFGRLAGGIAHDFNNVLAVIGTGISSLEARTPRDDEYREDVELIAQGVDRGRLLARRLLRFSRSPADAPTLIDLNQIVGDGQSMLERILVGPVALATDVALVPLVVRADRGEVEQILLNLVLNARDAMPSGGVVKVSTSEAHPRAAGRDVRYAAISVADTGMGMDATTKARMFEPFFTTKPPGLGTGLGLSTVREIVRRADGIIEVESAPGQGTTITVFWPCACGSEVGTTRVSGAGNNQNVA